MAFLLVGISGCSGPSVIPEMKEVIDNFTDRTKLAATLQKYGDPGVVPQELTLCDMAKPVVSKTEEKDGITYYTAGVPGGKVRGALRSGGGHGADLRHGVEGRKNRQICLGRAQGGQGRILT